MRHGMFEADIAELYNKLSKSSLRLDRYAWPFLPYIGSTFGNEGNPRIMYVGQATAAWSDDPWHHLIPGGHGTLDECVNAGVGTRELLDISNRFILRRVLPHYGVYPGDTDHHPCDPGIALKRCYQLTAGWFWGDAFGLPTMPA